MARTECTVDSGASADAVWDVWADVPGWSGWNPTMASVEFAGPFEPGASGTLEHISGRKSNFEIGDIRPGEAFTVVSRLVGARLLIEHEVEETSEWGTRVSQRAVLDGALARIWSLILTRQLRRDIAAGAEATAREAERSASG